MSTRSTRRQAIHCCPACAASVGGRAPHRRRRVPWAWVALLALVAALVPLAALDGEAGEPAVALAAPAPAPAPAPPEPKRPPKKPDPPDRPRVAWRESISLGNANAGSLVNGVRMPVEWPGLYTYDPVTQRPPGSPDRTWGAASLVRELLDLGDWWARNQPGQPRLGIGDISLEGGGPVGGHLSHENGLDADIRLVRADGREAGVDAASYDRGMTQVLVDRLVAQGASLVLIGPSLDLYGPAGVVVRWPNHDDHVHVRFPDLDGLAN